MAATATGRRRGFLKNTPQGLPGGALPSSYGRFKRTRSTTLGGQARKYLRAPGHADMSLRMRRAHVSTPEFPGACLEAHSPAHRVACIGAPPPKRSSRARCAASCSNTLWCFGRAMGRPRDVSSKPPPREPSGASRPPGCQRSPGAHRQSSVATALRPPRRLTSRLVA